MGQNDEIQIRALPRGSEKLKAESRSTSAAAKPAVQKLKATETKPPRRFVIYVGSAILAGLLISPLRYLRPNVRPPIPALTAAQNKKAHLREMSSLNARVNDEVNRHLQDSEIKSAMMRQAREMENSQFENARFEPNDTDIKKLHEDTMYDGPAESDTASQRVFEDLNDSERRVTSGDVSPADKINARLANRKWMNEQERAEKIEFIRSFVRSAYDKGYEVEIDGNLVVTGIHPIKKNKILNINQVIDRLAKQGY